MKKYSFFIDDNIFFLKDLTRNRPASVFEHFYLANLKRLHEKYGTKFLLNLYKGDQNSGFMLDEMPEIYRDEFISCNDWLRFSFHAAFDKTHYSAAPNCIASTAEEFIRDYNYVKREVERFAGKDGFMVPQIIHYVDSSAEIKKFLYDEGVRLLAERRSVFEKLAAETGNVVTGYADPEFPGLTRIPYELVLNNVPLDNVEPELLIRIEKEKRNYISIMTHEPQFYKEFWHFIPDHWERLDKAFALLSSRGYQPVWGSLIKSPDL